LLNLNLVSHFIKFRPDSLEDSYDNHMIIRLPFDRCNTRKIISLLEICITEKPDAFFISKVGNTEVVTTRLYDPLNPRTPYSITSYSMCHVALDSFPLDPDTTGVGFYSHLQQCHSFRISNQYNKIGISRRKK